jgi:hypothetical protein
MANDSIPRRDPATDRAPRGSDARTTDGRRAETDEPRSTIEGLLEEMIQSRIDELEREMETMERRLEEVDNFARISLNERKVKHAEANLAEFSESLTGFAEKAFNDINELEDRLDAHALLLAAVLDALSEADVDVDLSEVEAFRRPSVVLTESTEERLRTAIDDA